MLNNIYIYKENILITINELRTINNYLNDKCCNV